MKPNQMSIEQKLREVMDELQAQVVDGYAGPVNGWSTIKDKATQALLQIIESDVIGEDIQWQLDRNMLRAEQRANLREDK